jgi:hypothetical protein
MNEPAEQGGVDLARVALQAAKQAAKSRGTAPVHRDTARRRKASMRRTDGREPLSLAAAVTTMMSERAWQAPVAGGSLVDRWADLAPELGGKVAPVRFRAETGVLELRPASPAYGTQLRLLGQQLVARINAKLSEGQTGTAAPALVRAIRVLPAAAPPVPETAAAAGSPAPVAEPGPVRTRETASAGYRQALAAHHAAKGEHADPVTSAVRAAIERQDQALRQYREAEAEFADGQAAGEQLKAEAAAAADPRALALERAHEDKAGRLPKVQRLFGAA